MDFASLSDMQSIQGGLDPSGATGGFADNSDPSQGDSDYTVTGTPTEFRTVQNYTQARGATNTNPFPDSIFSRIFGAENVDYTNILGSDGVAEVNNLRFRQATGLPSLKTGQDYIMGDYYIGQPTMEGTVKETPRSGIMGLVENIPYLSTVTNLFGRNRGLPEGSDRFKELSEKAKENEFSMEPLTNLIKDGLGIFSLNTGQKAMNEMANNVDMINRTFDMFGDRLDTKQIDDFSQDGAEIPNFMTNPIRKNPMVETNFFQART